MATKELSWKVEVLPSLAALPAASSAAFPIADRTGQAQDRSSEATPALSLSLSSLSLSPLFLQDNNSVTGACSIRPNKLRHRVYRRRRTSRRGRNCNRTDKGIIASKLGFPGVKITRGRRFPTYKNQFRMLIFFTSVGKSLVALICLMLLISGAGVLAACVVRVQKR